MADTPVVIEDQTPRLGRVYITVASAIVMILVLLGAVGIHKSRIDRLIARAEVENAADATQLSRMISRDFASFVRSTNSSGSAIPDKARAEQLQQLFVDQSADSTIISIRLYRTDGWIISSTDPQEVGQFMDAGGSRSYNYAPDSRLERRRIDSLDESPSRLIVVTTYARVDLPGYVNWNRPTIEIQRDVTAHVRQIDRGVLIPTGGIILTLAALLGIYLVRSRSKPGQISADAGATSAAAPR